METPLPPKAEWEHARKISGQPIINPECISSHKMLDMPSERLLKSLICSWHSFSITGSKKTRPQWGLLPSPSPLGHTHLLLLPSQGSPFPSNVDLDPGLRYNEQEQQFQEVVGPCKSWRGLPLSEEPSGARDMCGLKSRLLGRYLFFGPPWANRVVVTSLESGSGCSNKVGQVGFLAGQEGAIDQCHPSFPPSSGPGVDVRDTGRSGKES